MATLSSPSLQATAAGGALLFPAGLDRIKPSSSAPVRKAAQRIVEVPKSNAMTVFVGATLDCFGFGPRMLCVARRFVGGGMLEDVDASSYDRRFSVWLKLSAGRES